MFLCDIVQKEENCQVELIIYGIVNSIILILMSFGFALVYGVSRVPNFAHGALFILASYMAWIFLNRFDLPYICPFCWRLSLLPS